MKNEEEDFDIEECSYSIGPDGSEFYHCTPEILGPSSSSILALDYNRMRLEKIEVYYHWDRVEGQSIPCLKFSFVSGNKFRLILFCYYYWRSADLSESTRIQPLPDLNPLTPFAEQESSLEISYNWHSFMEHPSWHGDYTSIYLKNKYASLTVNFYRMRFEIEKIESEDE